MRAYDYWTETGTAQCGPYPIATLSLRPNGFANANELQMSFPHEMPAEQQLVIADRVLAVVQRWRDGIARSAEVERATVDELAAAREEIARLKAEAEVA